MKYTTVKKVLGFCAKIVSLDLETTDPSNFTEKTHQVGKN